MAELLASWFLPPRTLLATTVKRSRGETRESRTGLRIRRNAGPWSPLFALDGGELVTENIDGPRVRFDRDGSGNAVALVLTWADGEAQRHLRSRR